MDSAGVRVVKEVAGVAGVVKAAKAETDNTFVFYRRYIMPGGDRTGPTGMGPRTGRAAGYCSGYAAPGSLNPIRGRGYGLGFERGFGFRGGRGPRWTGYPYANRYGAPYAPLYSQPEPNLQQNLEALQDEARYLEGALEDIKKRIAKLEDRKDQ